MKYFIGYYFFMIAFILKDEFVQGFYNKFYTLVNISNAFK